MVALLLQPDPEDRALRRWAAVSLGLHVLLGVAGLLYGYVRPLPPPVEMAMTVEFTNQEPPAVAQGEQPGPAAPPDPVPAPPDPSPSPPSPAPPTTAPPQPTPPPPPPPPAPAAPAVPGPTAPTPVPPPAAPRVVAPAPAAPAPAPTPPAAAPAAPRPAAAPPPPPTEALPAPPPPPPAPAPPAPTPAPARPAPPAPVAPAAPSPPRPAAPAPAAPASPAPPADRPVPPPPPAAPPSTPQASGTGTTPPVPRPEERSNSVLNTLERLRQQQAANRPPTARPTPQPGRPAPAGGAPTGTDLLNAGERAAVGERIAECWRVDQGMLGLSEMRVSLVAIVDRAGVIRNVEPGPDGVPGEPRARALYEQARRALRDPACSPLPVPPGRLQAGENRFQFNFSPRGFLR